MSRFANLPLNTCFHKGNFLNRLRARYYDQNQRAFILEDGYSILIEHHLLISGYCDTH